jgi:purine-binding chemotaxis protein CheW
MPAANNTKKKDEEQLVTFKLGKETFGIDIFKIKEVLHFHDVTRVPNAPEFVEGVIELRDQVIPVVDLKKRLGLGGVGNGRRRIVILDLPDRPLGIIVDDISKVLHIVLSRFESLPEALVDHGGEGPVSELAKSESDLIIVLKPEKILNRSEREAIVNLEENVAHGHDDAGA